MRLGEIMETSVDTVSASEPAETAWNRMRLRRIHHLIVMDGREVVGVLSDRDVGSARGSALREGRTAADLMSRGIVTAGPGTTVRQAANLMRGRSIGCLPVLDRGKLAGIVTTTDLLELLGRGAERPVSKAERRILDRRGPRVKPFKHW